MSPPSASRWPLLGLLLLFLVAWFPRCVAVEQYEERHPHADHPVIDEASYERWALEIAAGDWVGDEVFFQEPLYPYWLGTVYAAAGHERAVARHLQAVLGALTCVLVALLAARLFGVAPAVVAGLALALYRPAILLPCLLLKPNLFLPVLAGLALCLTATAARRPLALALLAGVLAGLGALLRGNLLVLLPAVVLWPLLRRVRAPGEPLAPLVRRCAMTALGVLAVLLPVAGRNAAVGGVFALTTSGAGTNLYGGNSPENPYGVATEFSWVRGIPEFEADDWRREAERRLGEELDPTEVSRYWMGELWRSVRADPLLHAGILWRKLRLTLGAYEVPDNHHLEWDARYVAILRGPFPGFDAWGLLGLAGLFWLASLCLSRRPEAWLPVERPRAALELAGLFLLYLATIVLTVTSMRARLPLVPLLLPFAGAFSMQLVRRAMQARGPGGWRELLSPVVCLALAIVVVNTSVFTEEQVERDLAERDYNHAVQLLRSGGAGEELERAHQTAVRLVERHDRTSRFRILLAETGYLRGRALLGGPENARGEEEVRAALQLLRPIATNPDVSQRERFRARRLAGAIQLEIGNPGAAVSHLRRAREFDDDDRELRLLLARALAGSADELEPGPERIGARAEARALLDGLLAEEPTPAQREVLVEQRRALEGGD